jgi:hypothetical protein
VRDTAGRRDTTLRRQAAVPRETPVRREPTLRRDTIVRRDTMSSSIRDILSRVPGASVARPDTHAPRDTGGRPDTAAVPPENPPL